jgi:hypothetical protein
MITEIRALRLHEIRSQLGTPAHRLPYHPFRLLQPLAQDHEDLMPDVTIPVGSYSIWTISVTQANGQPDTTSPITVNAAQPGFVLLDPVVPSAGNRQFYVSGIAITSNVTLVATDLAGRHAFAQVTVSQVDLSGIASGGFGPVFQGPHP